MWQNHRGFFLGSNYQDDPKTPEVTGFVVSCTLKKFRCSVLQCEAGSLQGGAACRAQAGKSKIYYFQHRVLPLVRKQHVLEGKQIKSMIILLFSLTFYTIYLTEQTLINTNNNKYTKLVCSQPWYMLCLHVRHFCAQRSTCGAKVWVEGKQMGVSFKWGTAKLVVILVSWYFVKIRLDAGGKSY